jgi:hypothetical protein
VFSLRSVPPCVSTTSVQQLLNLSTASKVWGRRFRRVPGNLCFKDSTTWKRNCRNSGRRRGPCVRLSKTKRVNLREYTGKKTVFQVFGRRRRTSALATQRGVYGKVPSLKRRRTSTGAGRGTSGRTSDEWRVSVCMNFPSSMQFLIRSCGVCDAWRSITIEGVREGMHLVAGRARRSRNKRTKVPSGVTETQESSSVRHEVRWVRRA